MSVHVLGFVAQSVYGARIRRSCRNVWLNGQWPPLSDAAASRLGVSVGKGSEGRLSPHVRMFHPITDWWMKSHSPHTTITETTQQREQRAIVDGMDRILRNICW